jgi:hypothetical protein
VVGYQFDHAIQMKHTLNGFLWWPAVEEFKAGDRRPRKSLYDPAGDGTKQHQAAPRGTWLGRSGSTTTDGSKRSLPGLDPAH